MKEESKEEIKEEASQETTIVTSQVSEISEVAQQPSEEVAPIEKEESKPEEAKIDEDPDTIFGLVDEEKLLANIATLGTQENQNYYNHEPPKVKKNLGDLFSKVYSIQPNNIQSEYLSCLASFY